jgi:Protein of unknown function (DUF2778)
MWKYVQSTGDLFLNGNYMETGYSGALPDGENKPYMECVKDVGPIPRGYYVIGAARTNPTLFTLPLTADNPQYCTLARSGFLIHGDNSTGTASHGCIVLSKGIRRTIAESDDKRLLVVRDSVESQRFVASGQRRWTAKSSQL